MPAVAGGVLFFLIVLGFASALIAFPLRVAYLCQGEPPEPCTCHGVGDAPDGFAFDRVSMGPGGGVMRAALILFGVGLVCFVAWFGYRRSRSVGETPIPSEGLFKLLPTIWLTMWLVAAVMVYNSRPGPCEDQGALGLPVGASSVACELSSA